MNFKLTSSNGRLAKTDDLWIEAVIHGRWVVAKVYNEPSTFGVNDSRVSKLSISKTDSRDPNQNFFPQMAYNYDRGLDFDHLEDDDLLYSIVDLLGKYRKTHLYETSGENQ